MSATGTDVGRTSSTEERLVDAERTPAVRWSGEQLRSDVAQRGSAIHGLFGALVRLGRGYARSGAGGEDTRAVGEMVRGPSLFFEPGGAATVEIGGPENDYPTRIEAVRDDRLVLTMPMRGQEYVSVAAGQPVTLIVARRMNPYFFETTVVAAELDSQPTLVVARPADRDGVQRRAHARVDVLIDAAFWIETDGRYGPMHYGTLLNVSAGGALIGVKGDLPPREPSPRAALAVQRTMPLNLPEKAQLLVKFSLPGPNASRVPDTGARPREAEGRGRPSERPVRESGRDVAGAILTGAETIRCWSREDEQERTARAALRWVDLAEADGERLARFVLARERELRQKGVV